MNKPIWSDSSHAKVSSLTIRENLSRHKLLNDALAELKKDGKKRLGDILVDKGVTDLDPHYRVLAESLRIDFFKLRDYEFDHRALSLVTVDIARKYSLIPLQTHNNSLLVAMENPTDHEAVNMLCFTTGQHVELAVASRDDIDWAIDKLYGPDNDTTDLELLEVNETASGISEQDIAEAERLGKEKPIVSLVNQMLLEGIRRRASDLHLYPTKNRVDMLIRVDGTLLKVRSFNKALLPALVSRIKIVSNLNITERRLPQDGRARVIYKGASTDLRISVIPTVDGESVVIRILSSHIGLKPISQIGFSPNDAAIFTDLLHRNNGLLLVTGPTGSGKTTTLYAALDDIRKQNVKTITVEDPVEYRIEGTEQIQVNPATGYTFATALRHILRHDPDVILIGEIRDQETAKIAIESALTGHLVLSTLHTNDAASTVTRLIEMGIEPYLVSSTLLGVVAQRLVRCNCQRCIAEEEVADSIRRVLGVTRTEQFFRGHGCQHCNQTGYSGRIAAYELLSVTANMRKHMMNGATSDSIYKQAVRDNMVPLTENALVRAREKKTSLAEVYRVRLQ